MLRLTVTQAPDGQVQVGEHIVVGPQGASIGRGAENTWCLADEHRLLSRVHLTIALQRDGFVLADLSTNGVSVNGMQLPRGICHLLQQDDLIRLGDYDLHTDFLADDEFPATDRSQSGVSDADRGPSADATAVDNLFQSDPEQWLLTQLSEAPESAKADGALGDGTEAGLDADRRTTLQAALDSVFGEGIRRCSEEEQLTLVRELCELVERCHPEWPSQFRSGPDEPAASTFEQICVRIRTLE